MRAPLLMACFLAALLALAPDDDLRAAPLLTNGGFEAGVSGWQWQGGSLQIVTAPEPVAEGGRAAALTLTSATARISQPVELEPGGSYRLRGRVLFTDPGIDRVHLNLTWVETNGGTQTVSAGLLRNPSASYRSLSRIVAISCDVVEGRVEVVVSGAADSTVYLDDLRLETVGTPYPCPTPTVPPTLPPTAPSPGVPATPTAPTGDNPQPPGPAGPEASPTPSHGLLVNGGFEAAENGRPVAWRTQGGVLTQAATPVRSDRFAAGFASSSPATKWIYQTIAVTPTAWYELEGYVYLDDPRTEAAFLRISWYVSADGSGRAAATVDSTSRLEQPEARYRHLTTGPVQAPPGVHSAKVRVLLRPRSSASALIYIDDVSFRPAAPGPLEGEDVGPARTGGRSDGRRSSEVLGASQRDGTWSYTPLPTPVIRRSAQATAQSESPSSGGLPWWPWALAGGVLAVGGAVGWGAWRWRRAEGRMVRADQWRAPSNYRRFLSRITERITRKVRITGRSKNDHSRG